MNTKSLFIVFATALTGSLSALWIHAAWMSSNLSKTSQVFVNPQTTRLVNHTGDAFNAPGLNQAAEKALPCVVHIKTTSNTNNTRKGNM